MPANRQPCPGVRGGVPGDPRDTAKATLPESQPPEGVSGHPRERRLKPAPAPAEGYQSGLARHPVRSVGTAPGSQDCAGSSPETRRRDVAGVALADLSMTPLETVRPHPGLNRISGFFSNIACELRSPVTESNRRPSPYHWVPISLPTRHFSERPGQKLYFSSVERGSGRFAPDAASQIPPNRSRRRSPCPTTALPGPISFRYPLPCKQSARPQSAVCSAPTVTRRPAITHSHSRLVMSPALSVGRPSRCTTATGTNRCAGSAW